MREHAASAGRHSRATPGAAGAAIRRLEALREARLASVGGGKPAANNAGSLPRSGTSRAAAEQLQRLAPGDAPLSDGYLLEPRAAFRQQGASNVGVPAAATPRGRGTGLREQPLKPQARCRRRADRRIDPGTVAPLAGRSRAAHPPSGVRRAIWCESAKRAMPRSRAYRPRGRLLGEVEIHQEGVARREPVPSKRR